MKRRLFLSGITSAAAFGSGGTGHAEVRKTDLKAETSHIRKKDNILSTIGNKSLESIRDVFHHELYELTIPLWKNKGVDWEYGGYLPDVDANGEYSTTNKQLYYQGRMLWLFSYFYNNFDKDDYHLRAADNGYRFLVKYCIDDNYDWFTEVKRDGTPVERFFDIYAGIFTVLGLGEYYRATGDASARDLASKSTIRILEHVLSPCYQAQGHGPWYEPGTKRLGTWLHILSTLTPLLRYTDDPGLAKIAKMCVRNILSRHYQPEIGLAFETLQPDYTPYPDDIFIDDEERGFQNQARWVNNFHTMEAAWMMMDEALRVGNRDIFAAAMSFGRSHIEKCWVERGDEQGIIQFLRPDDEHPTDNREICKPYVFKEIFIMLLFVIEHTHADWAIEWFDRAFGYAYTKPLDWPYRDTLHQPRGVMFCLACLNRMIERGGKRSEFFG